MTIFFFKFPNYTFLVPNLDIFVFSRNFAVRQIWRCWFQIWQQFFFKFQPKITRFKDFYFWTKLCNKTNSRTLIWNMKITFSNSIPKTRKLGVLGPKYKDLNFAPNFAVWRPWLPIWQWLFRILVRKYPNKTIFCPKCKYFLILHEASHIEKFEGTD